MLAVRTFGGWQLPLQTSIISPELRGNLKAADKQDFVSTQVTELAGA
jgi:hypothetical protein